MHMVLELPPGLVSPVVTAAERHGVRIAALDHRYYAGPVTGHGLVLGYGAADLAGVRRGCRVIAGILAGSRNGPPGGPPGPSGVRPAPPDVPPGAAELPSAAAGQVAGSARGVRVSRLMSMAPGPPQVQPGTWEAPK